MSQQEYSITPSNWQPRRVLVTGYYDGPTEGIIDFGDSIGVYCFKAVAFDFNHEKRVLTLARVAPGQLDSIIMNLSLVLGPPKWPFWVPVWLFSDPNARCSAEAELDALCASGETVMAVLTDEGLEKCFAVRQIDERSTSAVSDWFSLFA